MDDDYILYHVTLAISVNYKLTHANVMLTLTTVYAVMAHHLRIESCNKNNYQKNIKKKKHFKNSYVKNIIFLTKLCF